MARPTTQGMWSSSIEEENSWIDALHSLARNNGRGRIETTSDTTSYIKSTEIPKIIHFIWLGPKSIPKFPYLSISDVSGCSDNGLEWNECMLSWKKHHPSSDGWRIHVWTDKDIICGDGKEFNEFQLIALQMRNEEGFKHAMKIQHYALASDILRLEILNKFGGIYVDIDYWCIQCLDVIRSSHESSNQSLPRVQFFCGESNTGCLELNNGLMACCIGGHPIVWEMIQSVQTYCKNLLGAPIILQTEVDSIKTALSSFLDMETLNAMQGIRLTRPELTPSHMDVIENSGPGLLTRTVFRWLCNDERGTEICESGTINEHNNSNKYFCVSQVVVFSSDVFHPFPNHLRKDFESKPHEFIIPDVTISIHLWACSWQSDWTI